ncbi:MAG: hypothetical protein H0V31_04975 [Acidobacteria bacterium]|nr:hypothetical protein [Acidobacteriota bacterium]
MPEKNQYLNQIFIFQTGFCFSIKKPLAKYGTLEKFQSCRQRETQVKPCQNRLRQRTV